MQSYSLRVLTCLNSALQRLGVKQNFTAIYNVTPELVTALAENHFNRTITDLIWFLENYLQKEYQTSEKVIPHLKNDEFKRGDLFTVLSAAEIVYSILRRGTMPSFPPMSAEVCQLLKRKRDTMTAHGQFVRENMHVSGGCDKARQNVQEYASRRNQAKEDKNRQDCDSEGQKDENAFNYLASQAKPDLLLLKKELFNEYITPIVEKYYRSYQNEDEVKMTIFRLQRKLNYLIDRQISHQQQEFTRYQSEINTTIARQFKQALSIERMNLRDEAKWRKDEREYRRRQSQNAAAGVRTRSLNQKEEHQEKQQQLQEKIQVLRADELCYVAQQRKEQEQKAFKQIEQKIQSKMAFKTPPVQVSERNITERLRLYQGAETTYNDGIYAKGPYV